MENLQFLSQGHKSIFKIPKFPSLAVAIYWVIAVCREHLDAFHAVRLNLSTEGIIPISENAKAKDQANYTTFSRAPSPLLYLLARSGPIILALVLLFVTPGFTDLDCNLTLSF